MKLSSQAEFVKLSAKLGASIHKVGARIPFDYTHRHAGSREFSSLWCL
jgi:hypothetical protein